MAEPEEPPPIVGSWSRLYLLVIGFLITLIVLFGMFARMFS